MAQFGELTFRRLAEWDWGRRYLHDRYGYYERHV